MRLLNWNGTIIFWTVAVDSSKFFALTFLCLCFANKSLDLIQFYLLLLFSIRQWYNGTLEDFWKTIQMKVTEHEERCVLKLTFFMDPSESALNVLCNNCNFLAMIKWSKSKAIALSFELWAVRVWPARILIDSLL